MKVALLLLSLLAAATAIDRIIVRGNKFFNQRTGAQFYVKGLDYQPTTSSPDPLADYTSLSRDLTYFNQLGINVLRIYSLALNGTVGRYTQSLNLLDQSNIYLLLDVTESSTSIHAGQPAWNLDQFNAIQAKINPFIGLNVTFGFLAGNEVVNTYNDTVAAPYIKASIRDIKSYIQSKGGFNLVGYAATDNPVFSTRLQYYLDCQSRATSVDFYGLNTYRGCGQDSYQTSGFQNLVTNEITTYAAPFILTEFGCNAVLPRTFNVTDYLYTSPVTNLLSGGLVYQYTNETNGYGLVTIASGQVTTLADFTNLQSQLSKVNPPTVTLAATADTTQNVDACPSTTPGSFLASTSSTLPPTPNATLCSCMFNQLSCIITTSDPVKIQAATDYACTLKSGVYCNAVSTNSLTATYGYYSGCSAIQRASYIVNAATAGESANGATCSYGGAASVVTPTACPAGVTAPTAPSAIPTSPATGTTTNAGTSVGTSAGTTAGTSAGTSAGTTAGTSVGTTAGTTASTTAGTSVGTTGTVTGGTGSATSTTGVSTGVTAAGSGVGGTVTGTAAGTTTGTTKGDASAMALSAAVMAVVGMIML